MDRDIHSADGDRECDGEQPRAAPGGSQLLSAAHWDALSQKLQLSERQLELVKGVLDDLSAFTIARQCRISESTVKTHFRRLYSKLGVSSRAGMVTLVLTEYMRMPYSASGQ